MLKRHARLVGFTTVTALAAALASRTPAGAQTSKKLFVDLRMFAAGAPSHIDPRMGGGSEVSILVFDSLTDTDANGKTVPASATSWKTADSGKTWIFTLKKGAKFSNSEPVTPTHFARTWINTASSAFASTTPGRGPRQ